MTTIDTTLYANGALRLTRHGAGRGGNVLLLVNNGNGRTEQCELTDAKADELEAGFLQSGSAPIAMFDVIRSIHAIPGSYRDAPRREDHIEQVRTSRY